MDFKLPINEFVEDVEIAVAEKKVEMLKLRRRLRKIGMSDTDLNCLIPSSYRQTESKAPCTAQTEENTIDVDAKEKLHEVNSLLEKPAPNLADYGISQTTMSLMHMMEMGVDVPRVPSLKQSLLSPSPNIYKLKPVMPMKKIQPLTDMTSNGFQTSQAFTYDEFASTPDLFRKKDPPNVWKTPNSMPKRAGCNNRNRTGSTKANGATMAGKITKIIGNSPKGDSSRRKINTVVRNVKEIASPVAPVLSSNSFNELPSMKITSTAVNPESFDTLARLKIFMETEIQSPVSPELTISLDKLKLK